MASMFSGILDYLLEREERKEEEKKEEERKWKAVNNGK